MPAVSPTLSPTLSAITAGLRGSSSGIPASTLPTKSAPTSAALVKIPPPIRAKNAIALAPKAKLLITTGSRNSMYNTETPNKPRPTTDRPITAPALNETLNALFRLWRAASVVRALALVVEVIPT